MSDTPAPDKNTTTVKLKRPIEFAGRKIDAITLRRPKAKDSINTRRAHPSDVDFQLFLIANLSEIEPDALLELDMGDYTALGNAINDFFILTEDDVRTAVLLLANYTGWSHAELMEMDAEELTAWVNRIPQPNEKT